MSCLYVLVGDKDLPARDDLSQRDGAVLLPVLDGLSRVDKDDVVVVVALVVDLNLRCVSSHIDGCVFVGSWLMGWVDCKMDVCL